MRTAELVTHFAVSERTLLRWRTEEGLPHFLVGGVVLFDQTEVDSWLESFRVRASIARRAKRNPLLRPLARRLHAI